MMNYGYNNYGAYPAQGFYNPPMPDQLTQLRNPQFQQPQPSPIQSQPAPIQNSRIWVSGEKEAVDYLVAPNCAVDLWDVNGTTLYVKQADASGRPTIKVYGITEQVSVPAKPNESESTSFVSKAEFSEISSRLDGLEDEIESLKARKANSQKKGIRESEISE